MSNERRRLALAGVILALAGCAREDPKPIPREFDFGARRVQVMVPVGWKRLIKAR